MNAIVWTSYGPPDALQLREIEKPIPKENELLIKVHAATVTMGDCELRRLKFTPLIWLPLRLYVGWRKPHRITILGQELAGEVTAVGPHVTRFKPGDAVFAALGIRLGAYAEYICLPETAVGVMVCPKPANMSYEEAATIPTGGLNAIHFLRLSQVQRGERCWSTARGAA